MPTVQGTWRASRLTKLCPIEKSIRAEEGVRAQLKADALKALKSMLTASEYETIADQCQRGEREVRLENGFIMTCFSPK